LDLQNAHVTRYSNDPLDTAAILRTRRRPAVPLGVERTVPVDAPVGVRTEVVALALREVGRQPGAAIGVVVGQRDTRRRHGDAEPHSCLDEPAPGWLTRSHCVAEGRIEQQVDQLGIARKRRANIAEQAGADDTAGAPDARRLARIDPVAVLLRSEEHTSELQSRENLVCRLLLEKKKYRLNETISSLQTI